MILALNELRTIQRAAMFFPCYFSIYTVKSAVLSTNIVAFCPYYI